jgi:hypothetical protein
VTAPRVSTQAELWGRIYAAFEPYRWLTDPDAEAALNRIAAKCLGLILPMAFSPSTGVVHEETVSLAAAQHLERYHACANPQWPDGAIIVVRYEGRSVVLDGNNRVNLWVRDGTQPQRDLLVIVPRLPDPGRSPGT